MVEYIWSMFSGCDRKICMLIKKKVIEKVACMKKHVFKYFSVQVMKHVVNATTGWV